MSDQTTANAVSVKNIYKNYGATEALRDLSLDFPKGQLTSLLGPSGCGKTTLLKIIAGLLPATQGEVFVNGSLVTKPGPDRAFVFQDFALMPWASVLRNVAFGLERLKIPSVKSVAQAGGALDLESKKKLYDWMASLRHT